MKLRRMLSVVLAAAIIATGIGPIEAKADEDVVTLEEASQAGKYILKETRYLASKNYGGFYYATDEKVSGSYVEWMLSKDEIASKKYVNLDKQPNTTYTVIASSETQYNFKVRYKTDSSEPGKLAMLVNDDYDHIILQGDPATDDSGYYYASFSPTLKKGQNVIRILVVKNGDNRYWCDIYDMQADERVTVNEEHNTLTPGSDKTEFKTWEFDDKGWAVNTGTKMANASMPSVDYDNYSIQDSTNYEKMPSISFTVVAPRSGYYDISQNFDMQGSMGTSGERDQDAEVHCYTILCVDAGTAANAAVSAKKQKCEFDSSRVGRVNTTTYLSQGTHTLTFTAAIAAETDSTKLNSIDLYENKYPTWFNVKSVELYGGLKKAETSISPTSIPAGYIVEANTYPATDNYGGFADTGADDGKLDGMNTGNTTSVTDIKKAGYLNRDARPNTSYSVKAPSAGDYYFEIRYDTAAENATTADHMAVSVNDETYYYTSEEIVSEITDADTNETPATTKAYRAKFCVPLQKGMNVLRFLPDPYGRKTYSYDLYYMTADRRVTVVSSDKQTLTPNSDFYNILNWSKDSTNNKMTDTGKYVGAAAETGVNFYNYKKDNLSKMPSFSVTVDAPEDGYYDISQAYASEDADNAACYMILRVDGVNYMRGFNKQQTGGKVNTSVYLRRGTHTLTFTSAISMATDTSGSDPSWSTTVQAEAEGNSYRGNYKRPESDSGENVTVGGANYGLLSTLTFKGLQAVQTETGLDSYPYVAYKITGVPSAGYYPVSVRYQLDGDDVGDRGTHNILFWANKVAYRAQFQAEEGVWGKATEYVKLEAGDNTVYCLPYDSDYYTAHPGTWVNQDYLTVGPQSCRMEAEDQGDANIHKYYNKDGPMVGGASADSQFVTSAMLEQNKSDINTFLENTCYVAYTVKAPSTGYYPVSVRYTLGNVDSIKEKYSFLLYAETTGSETTGAVYKAPFSLDGDTGTTSISKAYVKLQEGTNKIYCIPLNKEFEGESEQTKFWVDQDYLEVDFQTVAEKGYLESYDVMNVELYGGLAPVGSDRQVSPTSIDDVTRLRAGESGITWRYNTKNKPSIDNESYRVGNINRDGCDGLFQSFQDMSDIKWVEKSNLPSVSYIVNVPKAGEYFVRSVYTLKSKDGTNYLNYFMAVSVNDEQFAQAYFHPALPNKNMDSVSDVKVHLEQGYNVIRMISLVSDTNSIVDRLDQDYIEIYGGPGTVRINSAKNVVTHLKPEESQFYNNDRYSYYTATDSGSAEWAKQYWGGVQWTQVPVTCESFEQDLGLLQALPYVSYTVNVPAAGFYDLQTYTEHGGALKDHLVLIDIKEDEDGRPRSVYKMPVTQKKAGQRLDQNAQNLSVKLTAGKHTLVLTSILEMNSHGETRWSNMASLTISGGITKVAEQLDPLDGVSKTYTAPPKGLVAGSCYTADDSNNIAGVPFGTTVRTLKSNFCVTDQITIKTKAGKVVQDLDDFVTPGMQVIYQDDTTYTVPDLIGDLTADGNIDLCDLVNAVKCATGTISGRDSIGDINKEDLSGKINDKDIDEYRKVLLGNSDVLKYQETSIGADVISLLSRDLESKTESSVFMKNRDSYFTIQGNFQGDVYLTLYPHLGKGTKMSITVQIDDNDPAPIQLIRPYQLMTLKIADNLSKGSHTIKVSKNTGVDADNLYITSVQFTGEWTSQN